MIVFFYFALSRVLSTHFSSYHTPEQALFFSHEAGERQLFITCGSDFHGKTKPSISIRQHGYSGSFEELLKQLEGIL